MVLFIFLSVPIVWGQTGSIEGTVTDNNEESIPGVNVLLVETSQGAATDADGNYSITGVEPGTYTLRVTFVGYQTSNQQVTITAGETLQKDVSLSTGSLDLEEVVVTGYGTQQKRELTGSISNVGSDDIENIPVQNTEALLQGRASGMTVNTTSGNPGGGFSVNIRGRGSINAGSEPLYIVDGVQMSFAEQSGQTDRSPLNAINPDDIESIEVLKDAAAAAIYGSQAANGVVLITTKSGESGDTQISASIERGVRSNANEIDFMNIEDWYNYNVESIQNNPAYGASTFEEAASVWGSSFLPGYGYSADATVQEMQQKGTDWVDFATGQGVSQKYNMSVSGGDEQTAFYISGRYEDTEGTVLDNTYQNMGLRVNLDHEVSSRLDTRVKFNVSSEKQVGICQDGNFVNCPVTASYFEPPVTYPYLDNGEYNPNTAFGLTNNIAVLKNEVNRPVNTLQLIGNVGATYTLTDWMDITGSAGIDYRNTDDKRFDSIVANPSENGAVSQTDIKVANFNASLVANLAKTFNEVHNVSGLVGTEYRREKVDVVSARGTSLPAGFDVLNATANPNSASGFVTEYRLGSYFANAKYNFDERYYVQLTGRYDGSSRFGVDNRWGFFPSGSVAWRISEEDFFNASFINELKLRASYGITGNSDIGNFPSRALYDLSGTYNGVRGLAPGQLPNNQLTWEESEEINVGVDFELFESRLSGSIDAYSKDNNELLLNQPLPVDNGYSSIMDNVGSIRNQGLELSLESYNISTDDFTWTTRFNISIARNEVLELSEGQDQINNGFSNTIAVGHPLGVFRYVEYAGVNPADGRPFWYNAEGNLTYQPTEADRKFMDSGHEDVYGGFGNRFSYKGVTLDVFFQYSYGATAFDQSAWYFARSANQGGSIYEYVNDRWQQPGDVTYMPKAYWGNIYPGTADFRTQPGNNMTDDASYIRLKNVSLSYNLPTSVTEKVGLGNVRIFATGVNLLTWTQWPGFDPEAIGEDFDNSFGNTTAGSYPTARQVNAGIEIDF
jgi:TonB-linked SusC/RagA family outer membrane protein